MEFNLDNLKRNLMYPDYRHSIDKIVILFQPLIDKIISDESINVDYIQTSLTVDSANICLKLGSLQHLFEVDIVNVFEEYENINYDLRTNYTIVEAEKYEGIMVGSLKDILINADNNIF